MSQPNNPLVRKLECFHSLSQDDRALLERHCRPVTEYASKQDIIREGEAPEKVFLILSGFACRYKVIEDGRRQIMAYFVPGDFCDFQVFILKTMDHGIAALSRCRIVALDRAAILEWTERPAIARALWWASLVDSATLREWLVNLGQRPAEERIAHLLCELLVRLEAVGLARNDTFPLPITQTDLGDTMGISLVHANRMLMSLRDKHLIDFEGGNLIVRDVKGLRKLASFDPNYLHIDTAKPAPRNRAHATAAR